MSQRPLARRGRTSVTRATLLVTVAALFAACFSEEPDTSAPDAGGDVLVIEMTAELTFEPQHVTVQPGQTIRWHNTSNVPHTSTADPSQAADPDNVELPTGADPWDSGDIAPGGSFDLVLEQSGEYRYVCLPHEVGGMIGTITVAP